VLKSGGQWRMLPKDFPPWKTVYRYFRRGESTAYGRD
jgi:putative transposase